MSHIIIDTENLKGCWPSCVVLLSLFKKKTTGLSAVFNTLSPSGQGNFSVMVANKVF